MLILFDVDGTLTPSRGQIDPKFKHWLMHDLKHEFRLITGSDPDKNREQVGDDLWAFGTTYNCAGNHVFKKGIETYKSDWRIPSDLEWWLGAKVFSSLWMTRTGKHIEHRVGLCNFSTLGRNATPDQRKAYYEWDQVWNERTLTATLIKNVWPDVECTVAGETGIDIYAKGTGKDQVLPSLKYDQPIHFFGDRQDPAGNDYTLAQAILTNNTGKCYNVRDWTHTWQLLKELNDA
jgi:phosphomannomutase